MTAEPLTVPTPTVAIPPAVPAPRPAPDAAPTPVPVPAPGTPRGASLPTRESEPERGEPVARDAPTPRRGRTQTPAAHRGPVGHGAGVRLRPARATSTGTRPATRHTRPSPTPGDDAGAPRRRATGPLAVLVAAVMAASASVAVLHPLAPAAATEPPPPGAAVPLAPVAALRATTVAIPKLGVDGPLVDLGVDAAGTLVPPEAADVAGWFTGSAPPGEPGPTVLAGHVDSQAGPGVFFRLRELRRGDTVDVGRSDGTTVRYRVTAVKAVDKTAFPTSDVYGPAPGPELRLVTCGGAFDRAARRYLSDVIVFAVMV